MSEVKENQPELSFKLENMIEGLTFNQLRFITERQYCASDKEAATNIGLSPSTISKWKREGTPIDEVLDLMGQDGIITARNIRKRSLIKAMMVKVHGLDSDREPIRQNVATEIIEWEMGKAKNTTEVSGPDGGGLTIVIKPRD